MNGYFRVPRSLTRSRLWEDAHWKYKAIFLVILDHAVFVETPFDDHGTIINLRPGQFCASQDEIAKLCGKGFSKNDIQRGLARFVKYRFVGHEVIHKKSIITITHPETYDLICQASDAITDSKLNQKRSKNNSERKNEMNEENEKKGFAQTAAPPRNANNILFSFEKRRFENIQPRDIADWKKLYPSANVEKEMDKMIEWCLSNPTKAKSKKLWRKFITNWLSKTNDETINKEARSSNRSGPGVSNRDTTESDPSKTFDCSKDL